jgi:tetratricopeptide (TPR) repeat protein
VSRPWISAPPISACWVAAVGVAVAARLSCVFFGPALGGYDAVGHACYAFFLDLYHAVPHADQGWSYFHPPLHYLVGWALAQTGSPEAFARGLALFGSAASLGIALLTAAIVRLGLPGRPWLPLLAFVGVAFLPVHVYAGPMPGNEMTAALLGTAALASHLANQRRPAPSLLRDAATGALAGCALLTKYSAVVPLLAITGQLALRALRPGLAGPARARLVARLGLVAVVAAVICSGYYARNLREYGTPFPMGGHRPVVDAFEHQQPPGERSVWDLVSISPRLLVDPDPRAPHMLHSIWGTAYAGMWVHLDAEQSGLGASATRALLAVGLAPTALALLGLMVSLRVVWRDPEASADAALLLLTACGLASFVAFAYQTPTFAALKAMYLLNLSAAYGFFLARAVDALEARRRLRAAAVAGVAAAALVCAVAYARAPGTFPEETVQMAAVRDHFGDWEGAGAIYRRALAASEHPSDSGGPRLNPFWLQGMLAATELEAGHFERAYALYDASFRQRPVDASRPGVLGRGSPFTLNRLAVAAALAGDRTRARALLDAALGDRALPELLTSRAALRALDGDLPGAESDLQQALAIAPGLAPALHNQAWILDRRGDPGAAALQQRARRAAAAPPRDYPYGVGDGRGLNTQMFMLVLDRDGLDLYRPARARTGPRPAPPGAARD